VGKRSSFESRERDLYVTPQRAVEPLIPFLHRDGIQRFAEPCCGDGDLVRHLETFGLECVYAGDITFMRHRAGRASLMPSRGCSGGLKALLCFLSVGIYFYRHMNIQK
jgi:hypothetical protein